MSTVDCKYYKGLATPSVSAGACNDPLLIYNCTTIDASFNPDAGACCDIGQDVKMTYFLE